MATVSYEPPSALQCDVLFTRERIQQKVQELGRQISEDYAGKSVVLVGILKGCLVFLADLMREIDLPLELEFVSAASYRKGEVRSDQIVIGGGVAISLKDRHVLLVDGIVDSARTISVILKRLEAEEPASVEIVTLLDKPSSHRTDVSIRYRGFAIGNEFVVGYGLDNTQRYRNLPFVAKLNER